MKDRITDRIQQWRRIPTRAQRLAHHPERVAEVERQAQHPERVAEVELQARQRRRLRELELACSASLPAESGGLAADEGFPEEYPSAVEAG